MGPLPSYYIPVLLYYNNGHRRVCRPAEMARNLGPRAKSGNLENCVCFVIWDDFCDFLDYGNIWLYIWLYMPYIGIQRLVQPYIWPLTLISICWVLHNKIYIVKRANLCQVNKVLYSSVQERTSSGPQRFSSFRSAAGHHPHHSKYILQGVYGHIQQF